MNQLCQLLTLMLFASGISFYSTAQVSEKYQQYLFDYQEVSIQVKTLKKKLENAPLRGLLKQNRNSKVIINLPFPDGSTQQFRVVEAPILSPELSSERPDFKSYIAQGIDDPTATARFNITPLGYYGIISGINGISITEPVDKSKKNDNYITYYDHHILSEHQSQAQCGYDTGNFTDSQNTSAPLLLSNSCFQNGDNLRTYDMVLTCTGEFYQLNGNTNAGAEAALLNRVAQINAVYEKTLAISFSIVEYIINAGPLDDPFSDPTNTAISLDESEAHIHNKVTVSSWDIGHGFHEIICGGSCSWAGIAGLGVACTPDKARGYTYIPNDIPSHITIPLHEIGHMFACPHTNYGCNSGHFCGRYEPGQGSTIMSTSAGCDAGDYFAPRTDYFGIGSLQAIMDFVNSGNVPNNDDDCTSSVAPGWSDGATMSATGNNMPDSDANANNIDGLLIPHSTPFLLTGSGTDLDGSASLTYNWEQYDTDFGGSSAPDESGGNAAAPLFRSFPPSTSSERICPQLSSILDGNVTTGTGEVLPTVPRTLTWRLTVRDNEFGGGGIACDEITLMVGNDGPFKITSQNTTTTWTAGDSELITWNVANTNDAAYTCPNVDILYSSDGGYNFNVVLASGISNDGLEYITVPVNVTSLGRIKIVCSGESNIFFDINDSDITVISGCLAEGGTITNNNAVSAPAGSPDLDLFLLAGAAITSVSGVFDAGDPTSNLAVEYEFTGDCYQYTSTPVHETLEFYTAENETVTFTKTYQPDYTMMMTLYENAYDPNNECDNWLDSNGSFMSSSNSVLSGNTITHPLMQKVKYVLVSSPFFTSIPSVGNYEVSFSSPLYDVAGIIPDGFLYTYVIVDVGTGTIVIFDEDSDLSDPDVFPVGDYIVYGFSYDENLNLDTYVGGAFSALQSDVNNGAICADFSSNDVLVNILGPLPVELISFNGKLHGDRVLLNWQTATEINNDYFLIEKSTDGRNFEKLGTVHGNGNTYVSQQYELIDEQPIIGVNYYRLTQYDFDGSYEVFDQIVAIDYFAEYGIAVQPNPVKGDQIQLIYQTKISDNLQVDIYNSTGQRIKQLNIQTMAARNVFDFSLDGLSNGVYFIRTAQQGNIQSLRFVKTD